MTSAMTVADYLLAHQGDVPGERITAKKLQKLCYYAQAMSLAMAGKPLFQEQIQAWDQGPVVRPLWERFKDYQYHDLPVPTAAPDLPDEVRQILDLTLAVYGAQTATELSDMTHVADGPWSQATRNATISNALLREHYGPRLRAIAKPGSPRPINKATVRAKVFRDAEAVARYERGRLDFEAGNYSNSY